MRKGHEASCLPAFKGLQKILIASLNALYIRKECSKVKSPLKSRTTIIPSRADYLWLHDTQFKGPILCLTPPVICTDTIIHYRQPAVPPISVYWAQVLEVCLLWIHWLEWCKATFIKEYVPAVRSSDTYVYVDVQLCPCKCTSVLRCNCMSLAISVSTCVKDPIWSWPHQSTLTALSSMQVQLGLPTLLL